MKMRLNKYIQITSRMRNTFTKSILDLFSIKSDPIFITGDLGYNALEKLQSTYPNRFINAGIIEQSLTGIAAGIAYNNTQTFIYSIAPFVVFRNLEQIKIDICIHNLPVCIVGNGGGYGYGIMGATHHAIEDIAILSGLPNMTCWVPAFTNDVSFCIDEIYKLRKPAYLRLGLGKTHNYKGSISYVNKILNFDEPQITIVTLGPLIHNVLEACNGLKNIELFSILTIPFLEEPIELLRSIKITKKLLIFEEHIQRGGLAEYLSLYLTQKGIQIERLQAFNAKGYPSKLYGSQQFHLKESGLDVENIKKNIINNINDKY